MGSERIVQRGAEALLVKRGERLIKRRIKKGYRLRELDEKLRKLRTRAEARLLARAIEKAGINVPKVLKVDEGAKEIEMEFVKGKRLSDWLDSLESWEKVCMEIGRNIAALHEQDIVHGDLTTSNMILSLDGKLYFIDFGLGFGNARVEDKAVDLHLIKQALEAKHFTNWEKFFAKIIEGYKEASKNSEKVLARLNKVEARGRYKQSY
ncbi:Kae1-associated serine/threonine protein kinase [Candidatus Pacearchaeota archaeon]|nr:MAG: Kae1-associated serine/threonine protein kinase [Candidatus Pacearchaeota archaeon]